MFLFLPTNFLQPMNLVFAEGSVDIATAMCYNKHNDTQRHGEFKDKPSKMCF